MKKALAMLACFLILFTGFPAAAQNLHIYVREETLGNATVAFTRRYPRISGLHDAAAQEGLNRQIRQMTYTAYLRAGLTARQRGEPAVGSVLAEIRFQSDRLICLETTTRVRFGNRDADPQTDYRTFSLQTGKRLYFWDLFLKDGAIRRAVTDIFAQAASAHGEPAPEWVLKKLKAIDTLPFFLDGSNGTLCVVLTDENGRQTVPGVPTERLARYFDPELFPK